jgi:arylsulfatase A-like enzyme
MYDVSMQAPMLMRWPGKIKAGSINNDMTQTIDYAPTMLDAAGITVPAFMQGISLIPYITGKNKNFPRHELYYRFYEYKADHTVLEHMGIRGERYKLIYFYTVNEWEFYDLIKDPQEQHNLIKSPAYAKQIALLRTHLVDLKKYYKDTEPAGELK